MTGSAVWTVRQLASPGRPGAERSGYDEVYLREVAWTASFLQWTGGLLILFALGLVAVAG